MSECKRCGAFGMVLLATWVGLFVLMMWSVVSQGCADSRRVEALERDYRTHHPECKGLEAAK